MNKSPSLYEIRVQGHLAPRRLCCFEGLTVTHLPNGETVFVCPVPDQAALYGLLNWLRNLGVTLLSLRRLGKGNEGAQGQGDERPGDARTGKQEG